MREVQNDILIYTNFQSYTVVVKNGTSFPMSIQWQLMPYTKYGNSCQNATSWLVYIGGSFNPPAHPWISQVNLQNRSSSSSS